MKKIISALAFGTIIILLSAFSSPQDTAAITGKLTTAIDSSDLASSAVKSFIKSKLIPICSDATLVSAVKAQNAKNMSMDEITRIDTEWQEAEEELPIMTEVLTNACAERLIAIARDIGAIKEVFVMCNQGAIVGENNLTSDYYQGDEAKWQKSYNGGQGGIDIGQEKYDRSADTVIQQVSLPIFDSSGTVIGAITFGIATSGL